MPVDATARTRVAQRQADVARNRARAEADRAAALQDREQARAQARAAVADAQAIRAAAQRASADALESAAATMRETSVRLQDPAYRAQLIAEARAQGRTVTDSELQAGISRFASVADTTAARARQMREQETSGSDL